MTTNEAMVALWNSDETAAWALHPDRYDIMLEPFGTAALDATPLDDGDRVLDVGCGAGALTLAAASSVAPAGHAIGADISTSLLALARRRAETRRAVNVTFVEADMQVHRVDVAVDAIVSRFGVMFFADPAAAFTNLRVGTRRGGRLAFACWQPVAQNEWAKVPVLAVMSHVGVPTPPTPRCPRSLLVRRS